jgi:hypothetical protein
MAEKLREYDDVGVDFMSICLPGVGNNIMDSGLRTIEIIKDQVMPLL